MLVVSPAVRPDNRFVAECRDRGVEVTSEIEIFVQHCRARVIAVTGSNGKSTTASLIHHMLQNDPGWKYRSWLGGNIGNSLLPVVDDIAEDDVVILELSSFQLASLSESGFAPEIAVLTNFSPNHLDWHSTVDDYRAAKDVIFRRQTRQQYAVLPTDEDVFPLGPLGWKVRGVLHRFGLQDDGENGAFLEDGLLILRRHDTEDALRIALPPNLPGEHNRRNFAAAASAAWLAGSDPHSFAQALSRWTGIPDRLELVAEAGGIRFVNDSSSTTPESTIAAMEGFTSPIVLLLGGGDKGASVEELCASVSKNAAAVVLIGAIAERLHRQLSDCYPGLTAMVASDFREAFAAAVDMVPAGGIVLLSPGFSSFGWFRDYRDRGRQFTELAQQYAADNTSQ